MHVGRKELHVLLWLALDAPSRFRGGQLQQVLLKRVYSHVSEVKTSDNNLAKAGERCVCEARVEVCSGDGEDDTFRALLKVGS